MGGFRQSGLRDRRPSSSVVRPSSVRRPSSSVVVRPSVDRPSSNASIRRKGKWSKQTKWNETEMKLNTNTENGRFQAKWTSWSSSVVVRRPSVVRRRSSSVRPSSVRRQTQKFKEKEHARQPKTPAQDSKPIKQMKNMNKSKWKSQKPFSLVILGFWEHQNRIQHVHKPLHGTYELRSCQERRVIWICVKSVQKSHRTAYHKSYIII